MLVYQRTWATLRPSFPCGTIFTNIGSITLYNMGPTKQKNAFKCAKCAGSDHPVPAQSIIRAFAFRPYILYYPMALLEDSNRLHGCAGWSGPLLSTYTSYRVFACCSPYKIPQVPNQFHLTAKKGGWMTGRIDIIEIYWWQFHYSTLCRRVITSLH